MAIFLVAYTAIVQMCLDMVEGEDIVLCAKCLCCVTQIEYRVIELQNPSYVVRVVL